MIGTTQHYFIPADNIKYLSIYYFYTAGSCIKIVYDLFNI